ncbi:unnamed protein product, partial [Rotaria sordida]
MGAAQASKASNVINRSIVWLDASVNDTQENINAQQLLRTPMNHLKTYKDDHECEKYIQSVPKGHRIILIVGGRLGQLIVPRIHQLFQISSIFVYCMDKRNQEWTNAYKKVKGAIEELNELILQVLAAQEKQTSHDRFEQPLSINIFNTVNAGREKSTSELNGQFVHSQILIDCLLRMRSSSTDRHDFLTYCKKEYANDNSQLNFIREFEHDYAASSALTWYTRDCFLYKLLNKALRTQNIDLLYLYGFFIRDLYQQLKRNQYPAPIHLYRGQLMSKKEVQQLRNFIGQLISMNSFLSTTTDREVAIIFSGNDGVLNNDIQPVLFEIQADPDIGGIKPFADITSFSYMEDEEEVLMMLGAIFRIVHIRDESQLCIIQLVLCSENGHDVKPIFDQMKNDYHGDGNTNAGVFGIVLSNMGKFDEAEKYLLRSLDESPPEHHTEDTNAYNLSVYYVNLGNVASKKGDYNQSLNLLQKALKTRLQLRRSTDPSIADIHNLIGGVYCHKNEYQRAIESFNEALKIYRQAYDEDDAKLAEVFSNIGAVYFKQEKYLEALDYQQKVLNIQKKSLHENHHLLGGSYSNLASTYLYLRNTDLALEHFHKALKIYEKCLPSQHPNFANIYNNMGGLYVEKRDLQQALFCFEKAAVVLRQT